MVTRPCSPWWAMSLSCLGFRLVKFNLNKIQYIGMKKWKENHKKWTMRMHILVVLPMAEMKVRAHVSLWVQTGSFANYKFHHPFGVILVSISQSLLRGCCTDYSLSWIFWTPWFHPLLISSLRAGSQVSFS